MVTLSRSEAGRALAERVAELTLSHPVILAISPGAIRIACEMARQLGAEMDVVFPRAVPLPGRQISIGVVVLGRFYPDRMTMGEYQVSMEYAETLARFEGEVAHVQEQEHRGKTPALDLRGRTVVAVDDGSACSLAAYAVVETLHLQGAELVIYAAPLCPPGVSGRIEYDARVITLCPPSEFRSLKLVDSCLEGTSLEEAGCLIAESRQYAKVEKIGSHGEGEPEPWRSGPGERPFGGTARAAQHSSLS